MLILGAMQYRLGRHNEAHRTLEERTERLRQSTDTEGLYILACAEYFLAMARYQLGHDFQARQRLIEADDIAQRLKNVTSNWHWQVEFATLHRETAKLLGIDTDEEGAEDVAADKESEN